MSSFRDNDDDRKNFAICCKQLGGVDRTYIMRLALARLAAELSGNKSSVRTYVTPQPATLKALATLKGFAQEFAAAVRNFYPIDLPGQSEERAVKVRMARDLCSDVFDEMQPNLRLLRGLLKSTAPLLAETEFSSLQRSAWKLLRIRSSFVTSLVETAGSINEDQRREIQEYIDAINDMEPVLITLGYLPLPEVDGSKKAD